MEIVKVTLEGNDGTGKTYICEKLRKEFPEIEFRDRGEISKYVMLDKEDMENYIPLDDVTELFFILDCKPKISQQNILKRGDSIENDEYHTIKSLTHFRELFLKSKNIFQNAFVINNDNNDAFKQISIIIKTLKHLQK